MADQERIRKLADHFIDSYDNFAHVTDPNDLVIGSKPEEQEVKDIANELYSRGREDVATSLLDTFFGYNTPQSADPGRPLN